MTTELIPTIAEPWHETWTEFADSGMWAELRESLNLFHQLYPNHAVWQVNAEVLTRPGADSSKPTDNQID